jgi:small GTP-binding protein
MAEKLEKADSGIKVILIGDEGVGKTSLINVTVGGSKLFNDDEHSSFNATYSMKSFIVNKKEYKLNLWDTIGQEKLRSLTKLFFNKSKIVIFVYDITSKKSFQGLESWAEDVKNLIGDDIIKGVVGNKCDLYLKESVKEEEGEKYATSINAKFKITSAKTEPDGFVKFLNELLIDYLNTTKESETELNDSQQLSEHGPKRRKYFC